MLKKVKLATVPIRHKLVKRIAPKMFEAARLLDGTKTPRPMTLIVQSRFIGCKGLVGVEIGVAKADNSLSILEELPMQRLFLVDSYVPYADDGERRSFVDCEALAKLRLERFNEAVFIRKDSVDAVADIHELLDFVYIDGNHDYKYVKLDIDCYYPLVKRGGVIGGHDYDSCHPGVLKATQEFAEQENVRLHCLFPDWWIFK